MSEVLISVDNVSKKFCRSLKRSLWYGMQDMAGEIFGNSGVRELRQDEFWAVKDVSFKLKRGECLGLLGRNGAGKTTLLRMLNGLIKPDQGRIEMRGRVGALIALGAGFNPILTGRENIYVNASVLGLTKREIESKIDEIIDFSELNYFIDSPVQNFSSGMHARLGFSIAVAISPDILLLDEILAVGDIKFRMKCYNALNRKTESGCAAILVSHNTIDINRICTDCLVMDKGLTTYTGSVSNSIIEYQSSLLSNSNSGKSIGNIEFLSIEIINDAGLQVTEVETHDDITIIANLKINKTIEKARVNFHLDSNLGRLTSMSTQYDNLVLDLYPSITKVSFRIPRLSLLLGSYIIYFDIYGPSQSDFEAVSNPFPLRVVGPPIDTFGYGVCHTLFIDHKWSINRVPAKEYPPL